MKNILLIDDDNDFRSMLRKLLEKSKYRVFDAPSGILAMNIIRENHIDLVVTDIIMPDMDGIETIMKIRSQYPRVKMIAVSGGGRIGPTDYLNAARALGAAKVLTKPFPNEELLNSISEILKDS